MNDPSFDPSVLSIDADPMPRVSTRKPARHVHGRFFRGPVAWDWLMAAARLPGRALHVAIIVWDLVWRTDAMIVSLSLTCAAKELGCDRSSASRALASLARAGLVETKHTSGRKVEVTVLDAPVASAAPSSLPTSA